ncbi:MAG: P-loop NTPase [Acidimicrobiales bacterium]|nr:P-loop NTPase [Acidimicrobiales bacterium]
MPGPEVDRLRVLKDSVAALRRWWYLVIGLTLVGAATGWVTTPPPPSPDAPVESGPVFYRATHTLLMESASSSNQNANQSQVNLAQSAYLVSVGEIPENAAKALGVPVNQVQGSVIGIPRPDVGSIEVQAVAANEEQATKLADAAADALFAYVTDQARLSFESQRDEVVGELNRLDQELTDLLVRISQNPNNVSQLESQHQSLSNQYRLTYERFTQLAERGNGEIDLRSLGPATAVAIGESDYGAMRLQIRDGQTKSTAPNTESEVVKESAPPTPASAPTRAATGGIVGMALSVGLVLGLSRLDSRLRHRDDVEATTGLAVLAEVPPLGRHAVHNSEVIVHSKPRSQAAEAYRVVRSALLLTEPGQALEDKARDGAMVVMVTSANPGEGKTTTAANLAAALAEGGLRVLVINCDYRRPRIRHYLTPENAEAVHQPSAADPTSASRVTVSSTNIERVKLVDGIGEHDPEVNPLDVVAMQRRVIQSARAHYDVIVLDTAPFLTTNDAAELLSETDEILFVVRTGKTTRLAAQRLAELFARMDAPILGVVLNDSAETPAAQYYYTYYLDSSDKKKKSGGTNGSTPASGAARPGETTGEPVVATTSAVTPSSGNGVVTPAPAASGSEHG